MHKFEDGWLYKPNCLLPTGEDLPQGIKRIAVAVEYHGANYCGWQRQKHSPSVQQHVEKALSAVANEPVVTSCAGRTDSGVHASHQIIHFDTSAQRSTYNWIRGVSSQMPKTITLHWAKDVGGGFHARFSALSRSYRYILANQATPPALLHGQVTWCREPLDAGKMHESAQALLGKHDFSSFRGANCQSLSPFRSVLSVNVSRQGCFVIVDITANAFLLHMVRNVVGALVAVGLNKQPCTWMKELLERKDRKQGEATAAADGLYLVGVAYPPMFEIPQCQGDMALLTGLLT